MPTNRPPYVYLLPLLLLFGYGLMRSDSSPGSDFAGYYMGSREILHGRFQNAYDMETLNDRIAAEGYPGNFVAYAPFPPSTALVFAPFLVFRMGTAKLLFDILSCLLFGLTMVRAVRIFAIPPLVIALTPFVFFIPILNNLVFGQAYLLLTVLLLEGFIAYRQERELAAAGCWALAIVFKLTPVFLFLFLLLPRCARPPEPGGAGESRKRYRAAVYLCAACAALLLIAVAVTGPGVWKFYLSEIVPKMGRGELNDPFTFVFQTAFMLLKKVFLFDALLNPHPLYHSPYLFVGSMALFKAVVLSASIVITIRAKDELFSFAVWVMASLLVTPNGSSYSLVLLAIPFWALAARTGMLQRPRSPDRTRPPVSFGLATLVLGLACTIPVTRLGAWPVWAQFPRLYLLLLFFGLLLYAPRLSPRYRLWNGWLVGGLTALFFLLDFRSYLPATDGSSYVLPAEEHLFIYDYTVRDHRLVYFYRDDKGKHEATTAIPVAALTGDAVSLKDNQIFYRGRQITSSPDWKQKPCLLDGRSILYLSDEGRGVGFYTLRKISPGGQAAPLSYRSAHRR